MCFPCRSAHFVKLNLQIMGGLMAMPSYASVLSRAYFDKSNLDPINNWKGFEVRSEVCEWLSLQKLKARPKWINVPTVFSFFQGSPSRRWRGGKAAPSTTPPTRCCGRRARTRLCPAPASSSTAWCTGDCRDLDDDFFSTNIFWHYRVSTYSRNLF